MHILNGIPPAKSLYLGLFIVPPRHKLYNATMFDKENKTQFNPFYNSWPHYICCHQTHLTTFGSNKCEMASCR